MMSLRWRIMGSMALVILLTVLISVGVGYYATQYRLGVFVDRMGEHEESRLAREYAADGGGETAGEHEYLDHDEFLSAESHGFLSALLYITLIGGVLTVGVAILLAAWLSKRVTAPVVALTDATQAIARGGDAQLPVTSSDELGRMSAAFNRMTSALQAQRDLRGRLINDISHELNTPLSVIQLEAKGLRDGLQTPDSASDYIIQEVDRLRGLVTDLNWLAETDYDELRLNPEPTSICELLTAESDRWRPHAQSRQVELSLQLSSGLPDLSLDQTRMSQALGNILRNAIHHTDPGGNVTLGAWLESDGALAVSVADDGVGIHPDDLLRVFDRFYRAQQSRARGIGGIGLGLPIASAIIQAHGGSVTLTSDGPGHGATATFHIPNAAPQP